MCWLRNSVPLLRGGGVISEGVESKRPESMIGQGENEPNHSTGPVGGRHTEMTTHPRGPSRHDSVEV